MTTRRDRSEYFKIRNKENWNQRYAVEGDDRRYKALLDQYVNTGRTPKSTSKLYSMCSERGITVENAISQRREHLERIRAR